MSGTHAHGPHGHGSHGVPNRRRLQITLALAASYMLAEIVGGLMTAAAYLVLVERWMAAWVQDRKGPNRVGIPLTKVRLFGLGQPLAGARVQGLQDDAVPGLDPVAPDEEPVRRLSCHLFHELPRLCLRRVERARGRRPRPRVPASVDGPCGPPWAVGRAPVSVTSP